MKDYIKQRLREAINNLPDTTFQQQLKYQNTANLSDPKKRAGLNDIRARITKAITQADLSGDKGYFYTPEDGDGFYQVEFRHDGQIKTKHIRPSADMLQTGGAFHPTDVGTCKDFQNIARYCFVKAGKNGTALGLSPAADAANKALIIFKDEIITFLGGSYVDPTQSAQISKDKMSSQTAQHKVTKDGFDARQRQSTISMDADKAAEIDARQAAAKARIEKAMQRTKKF